MILAIVDNREVDRLNITDSQLDRLELHGWTFPVLNALLKGFEVCSLAFTQEADTMNPCPEAVQSLVAYALGGKLIRIQRVTE